MPASRSVPRRLLAVLLLVSLGTSLAAQETPAVRRILLHYITSGDSTVYLLGSVHMARSDVYPLGGHIEDAFMRSIRLVVEVDITKVDPAEMQVTLLSLGVLPAGKTLRSEMDPVSRRLWEKKLDEHGIPAEAFDPFRPWVAYMTLVSLDLVTLGYQPENGVDLHFLARAGDRQVVELETARQQLEIFAGFKDTEQRRLLEEYLEESSTLGPEISALMEAWLAGDAPGMETLLARGMGKSKSDKRMELALLRRRDTAMADGIERLLSLPGSSFVVIGVAHLVGEGSVVDLLSRRGYTVTVVSGG